MTCRWTIKDTINGLEGMILSTKLIEHDFNGIVNIEACEQAIDLLKAQEAKMMTLAEIKTMDAPVFFETKSGVIYDWVIRCNANEKYVFFAIRNGTIQTYRVDQYGISWRCWTSRPTNEQREARPWE